MSARFPFSEAAVDIAMGWVKTYRKEEGIDETNLQSDADIEVPLKDYVKAVLRRLYNEYGSDIGSGRFRALDGGSVEVRDSRFTGSAAVYQRSRFFVIIGEERGRGMAGATRDAYRQNAPQLEGQPAGQGREGLGCRSEEGLDLWGFRKA